MTDSEHKTTAEENVAQATLQSLDRTLQKTDPLLRQLGEKPNALIFDNKSPDPIPKGR